MLNRTASALISVLVLSACSRTGAQAKFASPPPVTYGLGDWNITVPATFVPVQYTDENFTACDTADGAGHICAIINAPRDATTFDYETFASALMASAMRNGYTDFRDTLWAKREAIYIESVKDNTRIMMWNVIENSRVHRFVCAGADTTGVRDVCKTIAASVKF
jgi:hypothetical protein